LGRTIRNISFLPGRLPAEPTGEKEPIERSDQ